MERKASGKVEYLGRNSGKPIIIAIEVELIAYPEVLDADGYKIETGRTRICKYVRCSAMYAGVAVGDGLQYHSNRNDKVVMSIGKVGLLVDRAAAVDAKIEQLTAEAKIDFPEYEKGEKEAAEKEALAAKNLEDAEKEYRKNIASGMCPKCGTWCYGDCEANNG